MCSQPDILLATPCFHVGRTTNLTGLLKGFLTHSCLTHLNCKLKLHGFLWMFVDVHATHSEFCMLVHKNEELLRLLNIFVWLGFAKPTDAHFFILYFTSCTK